MSNIAIGELAPPFRLPSADGRVVSTEDYRGKKNLVVWFTKGMACPFCRAHMSQIARAYPELQQLSAEVLEITPTTVPRAEAYARNFALPFPYLCDPDYVVRRAWTAEGVRAHSPLWYAKTFAKMMRSTAPVAESVFGAVTPTKREMKQMMRDDDVGFFILDRDGVVRFSMVGAYIDNDAPRPIPNNDVIVHELSLCA